jgi:hypothetical protein
VSSATHERFGQSELLPRWNKPVLVHRLPDLDRAALFQSFSGAPRRFQRSKIVPMLRMIRSPFENREHLLVDQSFSFGQLPGHGVESCVCAGSFFFWCAQSRASALR